MYFIFRKIRKKTFKAFQVCVSHPPPPPPRYGGGGTNNDEEIEEFFDETELTPLTGFA